MLLSQRNYGIPSTSTRHFSLKYFRYIEALRKQAILDAAQTEEVWDDIIAILKYWIPKLQIPLLFLGWEALGIVWSCIFVKWSFFDGLYFVSSGLATGGMYPIPSDSPSWYFLFVGIYVTLGAPIMAIVWYSLSLLLTLVRHWGNLLIM
jgi:hypothetical protein